MRTLRLAVFAHYDRDNKVDDYVVTYVAALRALVSDMIVVSTCPLPAEEQAKLTPYARVVCRENVGYDFLSWKIGLEAMEPLDIYDEVVICNDSVYGPLFPLAEMFTHMRETSCDFWGVTANHQFAFHLQSYFLVFRRRLVRSPFFAKFWRDVHAQVDKQQIIFDYEIGLTQRALAEGFAAATYFRPRPSDMLRALSRGLLGYFSQRNLPLLGPVSTRLGYGSGYAEGPLAIVSNPTHVLADIFIARRIPFVKAEIFRKNPHRVALSRIASALKRHAGFDVDVISRHVARVEPSPPYGAVTGLLSARV